MKRENNIIKHVEKEYRHMKEKYGSEGCYFEHYGYRPAMEFVYGYCDLKASLSGK